MTYVLERLAAFAEVGKFAILFSHYGCHKLTISAERPLTPRVVSCLAQAVHKAAVFVLPSS